MLSHLLPDLFAVWFFRPLLTRLEAGYVCGNQHPSVAHSGLSYLRKNHEHAHEPARTKASFASLLRCCFQEGTEA